LTGVVSVTAAKGRWIVPPDHAMWIPPNAEHAVEMLGPVAMRSVYVRQEAIAGLPDRLRVVAMSPLMRSLLVEAVAVEDPPSDPERAALVLGLVLHEIKRLPERPLGLPFPAERRMAELCRAFLARPSPHVTIDEWA